MEIRDRIESRLKALKLSVRGASVKAGLGETTLRNYLKGMSDSMTVSTAEKLAPVLKVSVRWLLHGESAEIVDIWDRIPTDRREQARDVLETFTKSS